MTPHLTPTPAPADVVATLEQLLDGAKDGHVIGLAFAVLLKRRRYMTATSGECHRDPTYTRGMLAALDDDLASLVRQRAEHSTR